MSLELSLMTAALHLCWGVLHVPMSAQAVYTHVMCDVLLQAGYGGTPTSDARLEKAVIPETLHCSPQQMDWWAWMLLHANLKQSQPKVHALAVYWSTVEARWQALALHRLQPVTQSLSFHDLTLCRYCHCW